MKMGCDDESSEPFLNTDTHTKKKQQVQTRCIEDFLLIGIKDFTSVKHKSK